MLGIGYVAALSAHGSTFSALIFLTRLSRASSISRVMAIGARSSCEIPARHQHYLRNQKARPRTPTDLPVAPIFRNRVKLSSEKYFAFPEYRISCITRPHPAPPRRGVSRSSRHVARGAMDALRRMDEAAPADGEIAWS
jgi:hypothetical protein